MLSDVTISIAGHSHSFPSLYLIAGALIVLLVFGWIIAATTSARIKEKQDDATELVSVQLERIGDALERLVAQNAQNTSWATNESGQRPEAAPSPRGRTTEAEESFSLALVSEMFPSEKEQPVESVKPGPSRAIPFSIFNR